MIDALYISASGLRSEQKQIDVISNNVANMQTPGFKRSRVHFVDVVAASVAAGSDPGRADFAGNGTRIDLTTTVFAQGDIRMTRNPLDIAIDGAGFFELQANDGSLVYSRDGQFRVDDEGYLSTVHGLRLSQSFPVPRDAIDIRVDGNGEVSVLLAGDVERTVLGIIELAAFAAPDVLKSIGDNSYAATHEAGVASYGRPGDPGFGRLQQGYVEMANVEMIDEMSALVMAQRAYQLNARVLQASDQILETINNLRR
jgi:flagellar basal-body rod protein FlgG